MSGFEEKDVDLEKRKRSLPRYKIKIKLIMHKFAKLLPIKENY